MTKTVFLHADTIHGVYALTYRELGGLLTTDQDFYDSLDSLKDGEKIITSVKIPSEIYQKINNEYGIN